MKKVPFVQQSINDFQVLLAYVAATIPAFSAARFWLRKHRVTSKEIPVYLEDLRSSFHTISSGEYHRHRFGGSEG